MTLCFSDIYALTHTARMRRRAELGLDRPRMSDPRDGEWLSSFYIARDSHVSCPMCQSLCPPGVCPDPRSPPSRPGRCPPPAPGTLTTFTRAPWGDQDQTLRDKGWQSRVSGPRSSLAGLTWDNTALVRAIAATPLSRQDVPTFHPPDITHRPPGESHSDRSSSASLVPCRQHNYRNKTLINDQCC